MAYGQCSVSAPSSAQAGDTVPVSVTVTNIGDAHRTFTLEIRASGTLLHRSYKTILKGESATWYSSFIMPAYSVTVLGWVEVWIFDHDEYCCSCSASVALYTPPPPEAVISDFTVASFSKA